MVFNAILTFLITLTTTQAFAEGAFIIEPGLGYRQETLKTTSIQQVKTETKYKGALGSLKFGYYTSTGISLSAIGEFSSGTAEQESLSTVQEIRMTHHYLGLQLGVSAMSSLKIYLGYSPVNELETKNESQLNSQFKLKGHTYQAGLQLFPWSRVGLGIQYNIHQYQEIFGPQYLLGTDPTLYFEKIDSQDVIFILNILI